MNNELIQFVDIILYRFEKSVQNSNKKFVYFKAGNNARSPSEILSHLVDLSNYSLGILNAAKPSYSENSLLEKINSNFLAMKSHLANNSGDADTTRKLINGPLSDTLTHIGQLALLRRLNGNPIAWENYTNVNT